VVFESLSSSMEDLRLGAFNPQTEQSGLSFTVLQILQVQAIDL